MYDMYHPLSPPHPSRGWDAIYDRSPTGLQDGGRAMRVSKGVAVHGTYACGRDEDVFTLYVHTSSG